MVRKTAATKAETATKQRATQKRGRATQELMGPRLLREMPVTSALISVRGRNGVSNKDRAKILLSALNRDCMGRIWVRNAIPGAAQDVILSAR